MEDYFALASGELVVGVLLVDGRQEKQRQIPLGDDNKKGKSKSGKATGQG